MADTSSSQAVASTSSSEPSSSFSQAQDLAMEVRPQAGPLPLKRGEIGFNEDLHGRAAVNITRPEPVATLPERHPADRDAPPRPSNDSHSTANPPASTSLPGTSTGPSEASASTPSLVKRRRKLGVFKLKAKKIPTYGGILLTTLVAFLIQCLVFAGTIAAWAISTVMVSKNSKNSDSPDDGSPSPSNSSAIFIHVVFGIAILGQLLFLERRLFRLRAERYAFKHPGEILPSSRMRRMGPEDPIIAFSPWNRPPLPTYAAALAQSGVGTGDVEDHIIAQPPPPAYGNTRGSVMLLSGFLRESLRVQRPLSERSERSVMSQAANDRPLSYQSNDEEWQEIQDAERARKLEETLARLERPAS